MILVKNKQRKVKVNVERLKEHAQKMLEIIGYPDFDLGILLTTSQEIHHYNKSYRGKNKPTDILSFPYHQLNAGEQISPQEEDDKNIGDLIISPLYVKEDLEKWNESFDDRMDTLLAHGIAHLLGYDHETDEEYAAMQKIEKKLLKSIR